MLKLKTKRIAITLLVLAGLISGINSPVIRYALQTIPTPLFGFLRMIIPLVLLTPIMLFTKRKKLKPKYIAVSMVYGVLIYFAANGLFYLGVKSSGAVNAAIIGLLEPLLMFTFSVEVMKEKFSGRILSGIIIAFAGSIFVIFGPIIASESLNFRSNMTGNILLVCCALCSICGTWLAKVSLKHIDKLPMLFWSLVPGTLIYGAMSVGQWNQIPTLLHNAPVLYAVLYGATFNGLLAYFFSFYALKRIRGEEYGIFEYVGPAVSAIVAVAFFGEKFTPVLLVGVGVIAAGLYLAEVRRHKAAHFHFHHFLRGR